MVNVVGRESILKDSFGNFKKKYDYILIDCPPSLGLLSLNALNAVREVFIPIQTEFFALEGMSKLVGTMSISLKNLTFFFEITGIILTMFDSEKKYL